MHNLRQLRYVVEAARQGNITKASRVLLVSQPAISAAVRACEEEFGVQLFVRNPSQGLTLTPSGRTFLKRARKLLDEAEDFEQIFAENEEAISGRLELACYASPAPLLVPLVTRDFLKAHPAADIGLHEGDMQRVAGFLKDGTADLALTYDIFRDSDIDFEIITQLHPFAVMSKKNPLSKRRRLSLADLVDEPLIVQDSPGFREFFYNYFGMHGLTPHVAYRPSTYEMVRGMLSNGTGYSFALVKIKSARAYDGSQLADVELKEAAPAVHLVLAHLKGYRQRRIAEAFSKICKSRLSGIATGKPMT